MPLEIRVCRSVSEFTGQIFIKPTCREGFCGGHARSAEEEHARPQLPALNTLPCTQVGFRIHRSIEHMPDTT